MSEKQVNYAAMSLILFSQTHLKCGEGMTSGFPSSELKETRPLPMITPPFASPLPCRFVNREKLLFMSNSGGADLSPGRYMFLCRSPWKQASHLPCGSCHMARHDRATCHRILHHVSWPREAACRRVICRHHCATLWLRVVV